MTAAQGNSARHFFVISGILMLLTILFMILFRLEEVDKSEEDSEQDVKLFYMVPGEDTTNPDVLKQVKKDKLDLKELAARDSFDDPTIMSHPNKKYGFSLERNDNNEPPMPFLESYQLPLQTIDAPVSERVPLVGIYPDPAANDAGNLKSPSMDALEPLPERKEDLDKIIWLENGKEIKAPVSIADARKAAAGKIPNSRTEIRIEKLSTSPVIFLTGKSGIAALDKLVMDYLRKKLAKVFTAEAKAADLPDRVSVDWRFILR